MHLKSCDLHGMVHPDCTITEYQESHYEKVVPALFCLVFLPVVR